MVAMRVASVRATFYALEHLVRGVPIELAMSAPWAWQPGWRYELATP